MIKEIVERRSIRKYLDKPVPQEVLMDVLEAARIAPSEHNIQPWKYVVLTGEKKDKFLDVMEKGFAREKGENKYYTKTKGFSFATHSLRILRTAPVLLAVYRTNGKDIEDNDYTIDDRFESLFDILSIGASIENLILEAQAQGLGSLWTGTYGYAYPELREFLGENKMLVSVVALGYPDEAPAARPRKTMEEITEF